MSIPTGGKPSFNPEDPALIEKLKKGMELYRLDKDFKADPEPKDIKGKYFGSEPTAQSSDGKVSKMKKGFKKSEIQEDYKPSSEKPLKASKLDMPEPPTRIPVDPTIPTYPPPKFVDPNEIAKPTHEKLPDVAKEVLITRSQKSTSNRPQIPNMGELATNPRFLEQGKKANYKGEIKQSPEDMKAEKDFADKAEGFGYRFNTDFEMYLPIQEGSKEALTKDEMTAMVEGRFIPTSSSPKEVKYEGRTAQLDDFAAREFFRFDEDLGMYASRNPFSGDTFETIEEMQGRMTSLSENKAINDIAKSQGYNPVPGMDGVYINDDGDVKAADQFR